MSSDASTLPPPEFPTHEDCTTTSKLQTTASERQSNPDPYKELQISSLLHDNINTIATTPFEKDVPTGLKCKKRKESALDEHKSNVTRRSDNANVSLLDRSKENGGKKVTRHRKKKKVQTKGGSDRQGERTAIQKKGVTRKRQLKASKPKRRTTRDENSEAICKDGTSRLPPKPVDKEIVEGSCSKDIKGLDSMKSICRSTPVHMSKNTPKSNMIEHNIGFVTSKELTRNVEVSDVRLPPCAFKDNLRTTDQEPFSTNDQKPEAHGKIVLPSLKSLGLQRAEGSKKQEAGNGMDDGKHSNVKVVPPIETLQQVTLMKSENARNKRKKGNEEVGKNKKMAAAEISCTARQEMGTDEKKKTEDGNKELKPKKCYFLNRKVRNQGNETLLEEMIAQNKKLEREIQMLRSILVQRDKAYEECGEDSKIEMNQEGKNNVTQIIQGVSGGMYERVYISTLVDILSSLEMEEVPVQCLKARYEHTNVYLHCSEDGMQYIERQMSLGNKNEAVQKSVSEVFRNVHLRLLRETWEKAKCEMSRVLFHSLVTQITCRIQTLYSGVISGKLNIQWAHTISLDMARLLYMQLVPQCSEAATRVTKGLADVLRDIGQRLAFPADTSATVHSNACEVSVGIVRSVPAVADHVHMSDVHAIGRYWQIFSWRILRLKNRDRIKLEALNRPSIH